MEKSKVFWSPLAIKSLKETKSFILKHWHKKVLDLFLDLVDKRIEHVQNNPKIAPLFPGTVYRRLVIHKNVTLFYTIESSLIKILLVWDNRQNPKELKRRLED